MDTVTVKFTGPALSVLLYENSSSETDQEGFLIGDIVEIATNRVTDADQRVISTNRTIRVHSVLPCPHQFFFYENVGKVNLDKLKGFVENQYDKIVGWFKFKRSRCTSLTLREKVIHKELARCSKNVDEHFIMCLLSSDSTRDLSTHTFVQTCFRYYRAEFKKLPLQVINLSNPNRTYKSCEPHSDSFNKILKSLKVDKRTPKLEHITKIQEAVQTHLGELVTELAETEQEFFNLLMEMKNRKRNLKKNSDNLENGDALECSTSYIEVTPKLTKKYGKSRKTLQIEDAENSCNERLTRSKSNCNK